MTGRQLKQIIERSGIRTNAFAEKMGISPQSLNSVFNSADVKSGTIEKVAEALGHSSHNATTSVYIQRDQRK